MPSSAASLRDRVPALLNIATDPLAVLKALGTLATTVAAIVTCARAIKNRRERRKGDEIAAEAEAATEARVAPFGVAADPARAALELRLRVAELDAERARAQALLADSRAREVMLKRALEHANAEAASEKRARKRAEVIRDHLRRRNEALEYRLGDALVQPDEDAATWIVDDGDRTTPILPKPPGA